MERKKGPAASLTAAFLCLALGGGIPAPAHHSFAAYSGTQILTLKGAVLTFQWINPHAELKMLVALDDGDEPQEWNIETSSPAILTRFGWNQNSMKPGDRISVTCNPLSDGSHGCRLHTVVLVDSGRKLETKLSAQR